MKIRFIAITLIFLSGCAVSPLYFDGRSITYEHGTGRFKSVMADATQQCASVGKLVKHDRTDCPGRCVSTFSCVEK